MNQHPLLSDVENPVTPPPITPEQRRRMAPHTGQVRTINIDFGHQYEAETQLKIFNGLIFANILITIPIFCYFLVRYNESSSPSAAGPFWALLFFELLTIFELVFLPSKFHRMKKNKTLLLDLMLFSITRAIAYVGFIGYTSKWFGRDIGVTIFVLPDCLAYLCYTCRKEASLRIRSMNMMGMFLLYSIANYADSQSAMVLIFGFAFFFSIALLLFIILCSYIFVLAIVLKLYLLTPDQLNVIYPNFQSAFWRKYLALWLFSSYLFLIWLGYTLMIFGIFDAVVYGVLDNEPTAVSSTLAAAAYGVQYFALVHLIFGVYIVAMSWPQITKMLEKLRPREIIISKFSKSINLDFIQKGVNYFIKKTATKEPAAEQTKTVLDLTKPPECQICLTNFCDTLFEPCGHYVTCQICLNDYFKTSFNCLLCKQKIEKVHLIYFDSEEKKYKSEGVYEIQA